MCDKELLLGSMAHAFVASCNGKWLQIKPSVMFTQYGAWVQREKSEHVTCSSQTKVDKDTVCQPATETKVDTESDGDTLHWIFTDPLRHPYFHTSPPLSRLILIFSTCWWLQPKASVPVIARHSRYVSPPCRQSERRRHLRFRCPWSILCPSIHHMDCRMANWLFANNCIQRHLLLQTSRRASLLCRQSETHSRV